MDEDQLTEFLVKAFPLKWKNDEIVDYVFDYSTARMIAQKLIEEDLIK